MFSTVAICSRFCSRVALSGKLPPFVVKCIPYIQHKRTGQATNASAPSSNTHCSGLGSSRMYVEKLSKLCRGSACAVRIWLHVARVEDCIRIKYVLGRKMIDAILWTMVKAVQVVTQCQSKTVSVCHLHHNLAFFVQIRARSLCPLHTGSNCYVHPVHCIGLVFSSSNPDTP